jgi:type IV pilus assembly protein PilW
MMIATKHPTMHRQRGVGLIEVMIALAIGLVLLGALAYFFIGSQQINRTHDDLSRMQESGRNAMDILGKAIRQAGYRLDVDQALYVDATKNINAIAGTNGTGTGATALADTLTIRHDPAWISSTTNPVAGSEANCQGAIVTSNNDAFDSFGNRNINSNLIEYGFRIATVSGIPYLYCDTVAANPVTGGVALIENIENMQIKYGLMDAATGVITSYIDAPTTTQFAQVAAVRVSLLVRSPNATTAANQSQTYTYNGETVTVTDGYLRQVYTSTFTLRNQAK